MTVATQHTISNMMLSPPISEAIILMRRADPSDTRDAETRDEVLGMMLDLTSCGANVFHEMEYKDPSEENARKRC